MTTREIYERDRLKHPERYDDLREGVSAPKIFVPIKTVKRIRQDTKPLMNKLEREWFGIINAQFPNYPRPRAQAITLKLANGVRYTPDFFAFLWPVDAQPSSPTAWELKGKHVWDDAIVKLKVAATTFPEIRFLLVWKDHGDWHQQPVLS